MFVQRFENGEPTPMPAAAFRSIWEPHADRRERVASALDGLMIAPDLFGTTSSEYLGLHVGLQRLAAARTDDALRDVADYLWGMALQIEDGDLSGTERDLRAAQKELRDAIARGAPDEEIRRLT